MNKKISEIAKELDVKPGVVLKKLRDIGVEATSIASQVSPENQGKLLEAMGIKKGITTKKVTSVSDSGKVVSHKKVIIKSKPKTAAQKESSKYIVKNESSDLMSGMVRGDKKPASVVKKATKAEKPAAKPKPKKPVVKKGGKRQMKVTVIKKHHHDEETAAETPEVKPVAAKPVETKPDEIIKVTDKAIEETTETTTAKVESNKPSAEKKETSKAAKTEKEVEKAEAAVVKKSEPKKTVKEEPERKLGLTGRKIDLSPPKKKSVQEKRPARRPYGQTKPNVEATSAPASSGFDVENKKPAKSTYKKGSTRTSDRSDVNKKTPASRSSYTNTKKSKYRSHYVGGRTRNVNEVLSEDYILNEYYSDDNIRRRRSKRKGDLRPRREVLSSVRLPETMTVKSFAEKIKKQNSDVIMKLMALGMMATINDEIDFDTAALIALDYKITAELAATVTEEDILFDDDVEDPEESLVERAPVVVVMGHVDHGKTSLLDTIKNTNVVATEAGAITQHVGAYSVIVEDRQITFLDTPGHEAFTSMRRRGAQVTDIAIIVVAADDGIMPQTVEALNHAKEAGVSIIVAINKIDLPAANPDRVKQELTEYGVVPEEWGGDVICVPVSAKTGENIEGLLEMVLLTADVLELRANPDRQAKGTVIEAKLDAHRGVVATMLVQKGTLRAGDCVISGASVGRVRAMTNDKGETITEAGPSMPAVVLGFDEVPDAGEIFYSVEDEKVARNLAERRRFDKQQAKTARKPASLDELFGQIQDGSMKELKIIVKADVRGSVEAVTESLEKLSNDEVTVKVIHGAAGTISESDVSLAEVSGAIIIGFNVRPGHNVTTAAKDADVDIRLYRVIYNAVEDVEKAMKGMLDPKFREVVTGHAEIRQIFKVSGLGTIGGCMVTDGNIKRNQEIRVVRNGIVAYEGKLASLKRFQDDVREVQSGYECGLSVERYNDIKEGDVIEAFEMVEIKE